MKPRRSLRLEAIMALYRYFRWSDRMRFHLGELLAAAEARKQAGQPVSVEDQLFTYPYMSYWYAGTYAVIEGWTKRLQQSDAAIDKLLRSPNVAKLKSHRHGTFHYQPKYFDVRLVAFTTSDDWVDWIEQLCDEFHRWFVDYIEELEREEGNNLA